MGAGLMWLRVLEDIVLWKKLNLLEKSFLENLKSTAKNKELMLRQEEINLHKFREERSRLL